MTHVIYSFISSFTPSANMLEPISLPDPVLNAGNIMILKIRIYPMDWDNVMDKGRH